MTFFYQLLGVAAILGLIKLGQNPQLARPWRLGILVFVGLLYLIVLVALGFYALYAQEMGLAKRLLAGLLFFFLLGYGLFLVRKRKKA